MTVLDPFLGRITAADARRLPLPDSSVDGIAVTSPPYWRLREYGDDELELGRGTLEQYLAETLDALDELGRVLVDDALVWWNVGDTRTGSGGAGGDYSTGSRKGRRGFRQQAADRGGLARGQWALVPHRFAIGAQDRGWLVLAAVTWSKGKVRLRNGVPELLTRRRPEDLHHVKRPGISSEMVFLFARTLKARRRFRPSMLAETGDVWTFPPDAVKGRKHDAPYPPELVRRCILPTTLPGEIVLDPFAGSGTTIQVAEQHGRRAIGFDLYAPSSEVEKPEPSTVVGCVWGAHRKLVETFGDEAPSYAWCEERWKTVLRKRAPAEAAIPGWLYGELLFGWRGERAEEARG